MEEATRFYGRDDELIELKRKITLSPLTVLHGKSGFGKSSLVNAGLADLLKKENQIVPLSIRFQARQSDEELITSPARTTVSLVEQEIGTKDDYLVQLIEDDNSIWRAAKKYSFHATKTKDLLLIFDQFEELFTYSDKDILNFKSELAEALYTAVPERYWDVLPDRSGQIEQEELDALQHFPKVRVLIVIRSDRLHLLDKLSDFIPLILRNCQELGPLDLIHARNAIVAPALMEGDFISPVFTYAPDAISDILSFLTDVGSQPIESTQLQIICQHLEEKVTREKLEEVSTSSTENLGPVVENYYAARINEITVDKERMAARLLIEDALIFEQEERRLSIYEGQILEKIDRVTLKTLVDSHLLRAEPSIRGGYAYELSHDTLVGPILKARSQRVRAEQLAAEQREQSIRQAEIRKEKKKRYVAYGIALAGILLAAMAITAAVFAYRARTEAAERYFALQMENARRLKVEMAYPAALASLEELLLYVKGDTQRSSARDTLMVYQRVAELVTGARAITAENPRGALIRYQQARTISSDSALTQLVNQLEKDIQRQTKSLELEYRRWRDSGEEEAMENTLKKLRIVDPDNLLLKLD